MPKKVYARVIGKNQVERFYRCGFAFTRAWSVVDVDEATLNRLNEEQMLEVSEDQPKDFLTVEVAEPETPAAPAEPETPAAPAAPAESETPAAPAEQSAPAPAPAPETPAAPAEQSAPAPATAKVTPIAKAQAKAKSKAAK